MPHFETSDPIFKSTNTSDIELSLPPLPPYLHTPLVDSARLSSVAGCKLMLKQEFAQPSGSYKLRGLSHHIKTEIAAIEKDPKLKDRKILVVAASGGNAGNAVSYAAAHYGITATIVVPSVANMNMRTKIQDNGATVVVAGDNIGQADEYLRQVLIPQLPDDVLSIYCHPYEAPAVWEGHSSIVDEVVQDLERTGDLHRLKGVVCSIGGGGLYNGLVSGLNRNGLSHVPIMTLETSSCPTFQSAIDSGKSVILKSFNTIATTLACPYVTEKSVENYKSHKTKHILVKDSDAAHACLEFARDYNAIVEPACGVALCSVYDGLLQQNAEFFNGLGKDDIIVVIVCGGSATTMEDLRHYKESYNL